MIHYIVPPDLVATVIATYGTKSADNLKKFTYGVIGNGTYLIPQPIALAFPTFYNWSSLSTIDIRCAVYPIIS